MDTLDNAPIGVGDTIYDLVYGHGTVTSITSPTITAKFRNGRVLSYDPGGRINGVRRLYWHDPLVIAPPKDKKLWDAFRPIITGVYRLVVLKN